MSAGNYKHKAILRSFFSNEETVQKEFSGDPVEFFYDNSFEDYGLIVTVIKPKPPVLGEDYANNFVTFVEDIYRNKRIVTTVIL